MNKNIVVIILLILAGAAVYFYGWPKIQPYLGGGGDAGVVDETAPADPAAPPPATTQP